MDATIQQQTEDELVLSVSGAINSANAKEFQRLVSEVRDAWPAGRLILDIDEVTFL
ncbi:MAG: anti-sigma factor antagonist [Atopobiaceae bacterium]|nr:anti-sigma factor antagonist [Atopobiaceae bacterium]